jgi:hypothetical protein
MVKKALRALGSCKLLSIADALLRGGNRSAIGPTTIARASARQSSLAAILCGDADADSTHETTTGIDFASGTFTLSAHHTPQMIRGRTRCSRSNNCPPPMWDDSSGNIDIVGSSRRPL